MKRETLIQVIIILILTAMLGRLVYMTVIEMNSTNPRMFGMNPIEEEIEKDTKKEDVDTGEMINANTIKLDEYDSNITIEEGGEYNIEGSFNHSILVDSSNKVILNLNNVSINSDITAAIGNKGTGEMVINLVEGTTNILKDNGSSELDGCIYSSGKLTIEGNGKLEVYGNQEEGEGIATTDANITINGENIYIESADDGINAGGDNGGVLTINGGNIVVKAGGDGIDSNKDLIINGGEVIALGSDMLQNPDNESKLCKLYIKF